MLFPHIPGFFAVSVRTALSSDGTAAAAHFASSGATRAIKHLAPPLIKKCSTAYARKRYSPNSFSDKYPPYFLLKSEKFVTSCGRPSTGPLSANPINPAVLVPTPSIGFEPESNSSTYTPGDKYSAITFISPFSHITVMIRLVFHIIAGVAKHFLNKSFLLSIIFYIPIFLRIFRQNIFPYFL